MKHVNCITINTDASFNTQNKIGAWAFWIVYDKFRLKKAGPFKSQPQNPTDAEMMCIANALYSLSIQKNLPTTSLIVINTDSTHAITHIKLKSKNPIGKKTALLLREVRNKTAYRSVLPQFNFRHVKAHTQKKDPRSIVNEWCDKNAKEQMRLALEQFKAKKHENRLRKS